MIAQPARLDRRRRDPPSSTANDRFKGLFDNWLWGSVIVATLLHFAVFALWPEMTAPGVALDSEEIEVIELPPKFELPPPPEQIARPATPIISEAEIDESITIHPNTFDENPVPDLPPPPQDEEEVVARPGFTPYEVAPRLLNTEEVVWAMERAYPAALRDAGIGGTVRVLFFVDEEGVVRKTRIDETSGYDPLDDAALEVADVYRFSPALNRDVRVAVWISLPIRFKVR